MDKIGAIGNDIYIGANATYAFWKHIFQLLLELGTFGYLQFELEREKISESSLKDINGRYLKFKPKIRIPAVVPNSMTNTNEELQK